MGFAAEETIAVGAVIPLCLNEFHHLNNPFTFMTEGNSFG